jgi:hypothetical protein
MQANFKSAVALVFLLMSASTAAMAADVPVGQREYENRCAMCHGLAGKGDGWLAEFLTYRVPVLVALKKNNGGVFPFDRVYKVIDGRAEVAAHGPRSMPVWGGVYRVESERAFDPFIGQYYPDEGMIRARILALIEHLSRLQE